MGDCIYRTAPDRIELALDQRGQLVQTVRLESSADLDTWSTIESVPAKPSPVSPGLGQSFRGKIYHRFDPADFSLTFPFWIRFVDVLGGVDDAISAAYIVFNPSDANQQILEITGTAPNEAAIVDSQQIILPGTNGLRIDVTSGADLLMALASNGPERTVTSTVPYEKESRFEQLYLRGDGGTSDFLLAVTLEH